MDFDYDENVEQREKLKRIVEGITGLSPKEIVSENKQEEQTEPEVVEEGWFDRVMAQYRARKEGGAVDRYNQRLNQKMNDPKRYSVTGKHELDDSGNPTNKVVPARTIGQKSKLSRMHEARINSVTNSMFKDLVKLGIILDDDSNFKDAINNFIKALSILSIYEHSPMSGKKWSWTEVNRQLLERYIRPSLEAITKGKRDPNGGGGVVKKTANGMSNGL